MRTGKRGRGNQASETFITGHTVSEKSIDRAVVPRLYPQARRYSLQWGQLMAGLVVYAIAICLMIKSDLGLGPWDAFHVGIHKLTGISIGMASIMVGAVIIVGTLFLSVKPGFGTVANMVLIGVFIDLLMPFVPKSAFWGVGVLYYTAGVALSGLATGMYIAAGLGKGPRDGLMIAISSRTGSPVGRVRTVIEIVVLGFGWLMGGKIGVGTVLFALTIGPATQWGLYVFGLSATGGPKTTDASGRPAATIPLSRLDKVA